jgi:hypothetical protein
MSSSSSFAVSSLLHLIPALLLTGGCVVYLIRARNLAGVILLISNLLSIAISFAWTLFSVLLMSGRGHGQPWVFPLQILSFLAGLGFGVGFLLMAFGAPRKDAGPDAPHPFT